MILTLISLFLFPSISSKPGTTIYCWISLNEQTRMHTSEEFASLIDVLFCQMEQLIVQIHPSAEYFFDNETILITLVEHDHQVANLAIEIYRFIHYVNEQTQWNLDYLLAIDTNPFSSDFIRWLREECLLKDRIYLSTQITSIFQDNPHYQLTIVHPNSIYYSLTNEQMSQTWTNPSFSTRTSDMIDQLTRIQAEYHVEKHLGTITLTRSIRKRSLFELTSKYLHWLTLNFSEPFLRTDFQSLHRTPHPQRLLYLFILFLLITAFFQGQMMHSLSILSFLCFPLLILLLILLFSYYMRQDHASKRKTFYIYFNLLICLTLTTSIFVAIQYHSILNFKSLLRLNHTTNITTNSTSSFSRQYHQYLILCPIYPLYFCTLFRQCSWLIKTSVILICSILQIYVYEYVWLTTNSYFPSITSLHHYTALTLLIIHQILLILMGYVHEWLAKIDFLWLKQLDHERSMIVRQRNQLIKQISMTFPQRMIQFYLNPLAHSSLTQHYHHKYEHMGLLYIHFDRDPSMLTELINTIDYALKTNERYSKIVLHRKSTSKALIFSMDLSSSLKSIEDLVELLFQIHEHLQSHEICLAACVHICPITEILIHLRNSPRIDLWSEHLSLMEYLLSKIQVKHCLITSSVYQVLQNLYLFRTAGAIIQTRWKIELNSQIYYLLGRLMGENVFQGRHTLPLTINQSQRNSLSITDPSASSNRLSSPTISSALIPQSSRHTLVKILHPPPLLSDEKLPSNKTNEETTSSFSGWDDNDKPLDSCDVTFTVNMTTTTAKKPPIVSPPRRRMGFNLARKLIAETSESEVSVHRQPWTRNIVYQQHARRSSSYNHLDK